MAGKKDLFQVRCREVRREDADRVAALVRSSGFFNEEEIDVARQLVVERLERGPKSGYEFAFAEWHGRLLGYTCFGPILGTDHRFDLYWIAVIPDHQGRGFGRRLLRVTEEAVRRRGGALLFVETSSRSLYASTRTFYRRCGYRPVACVPHYYAGGDHKVVFVRDLVADQ